MEGFTYLFTIKQARIRAILGINVQFKQSVSIAG